MTQVDDVDLIDAVRRGFERVRPNLENSAPTDRFKHPQRIVSNMDLLLDTLQAFYRRPESGYLPGYISRMIERLLARVESNLSKIETTPDDAAPVQGPQAESLLTTMDRLYALSLQYGIVSFGFDSKVAQDQLGQIRKYAADSQKILKEVSHEAQTSLKEYKERLAASVQAAADDGAKYSATLAQRLEAAESQVKQIQDGAASASEAVASSKKNLDEIRKSLTEANQAKEQVLAAVTDASTHRQKVMDAADEALRKSQTTESQIGEVSANAKARLKEATDAKAAIAGQLENITKFYGEIEKYKQEMVEVKKEATTTAGKLKEETEAQISDFSTRTGQIIKTNEDLISEIRDHLRKAVGITLFTAFDKRRGHIFWSSVVWGGLLGLSVIGAVAFALWFVHSLATTKIDGAIIYARLIIAAPIAFLITFASKQYARERRAEEEYAFKSAISVSLDSYRELIDRIRKENPSADLEFVKQLVLEVFDNPSKRLYPSKVEDNNAEEESPDFLETVNKLSETVDKFVAKFPNSK